jgi:hypothetical protein
LPDLRGSRDDAIERLASCVIHNEHRLPALVNEFQRPQRPGTIKVALKPVFVREAIDALGGGMIRAGRDGYEGVRVAINVIPP